MVNMYGNANGLHSPCHVRKIETIASDDEAINDKNMEVFMMMGGFG
jgi:hypothetical protein